MARFECTSIGVVIVKKPTELIERCRNQLKYGLPIAYEDQRAMWELVSGDKIARVIRCDTCNGDGECRCAQCRLGWTKAEHKCRGCGGEGKVPRGK